MEEIVARMWWRHFWWILTAMAVAVTLGLLWSGRAVLAQDDGSVRLSVLEIALWPEFDRPEVLVIFQGQLANDVPLPATLTLTLPQGVDEPHSVASVDEAGQRLNAAYEVQVVGDVVEVTYTSLEHRAFQFEYYWDFLEVEGSERRFTFRYSLDAPVDDLTLVVQQPSDATDVALNPLPTESFVGYADLTYHRLSLGAVEAGQTVEWQASYEAVSHLSIDIVAVIGLALALALGGLWFVGSRRQAKVRRLVSRSQQEKPPKPKGRKSRKGAQPRPSVSTGQPSHSPRTKQSTRQTEPAAPGGVTLFCHQCGTPLKADALFCHRCGLRRKDS